MSNGRVSRVTFPTASFSLTTDLILWVHERADALGKSKSEYIRSLITRDRETICEMERPMDTPVSEEAA